MYNCLAVQNSKITLATPYKKIVRVCNHIYLSFFKYKFDVYVHAAVQLSKMAKLLLATSYKRL